MNFNVKANANGWIDGSVGNTRFQAKVYSVGSKFGINNGRISKLMLWQRPINGGSNVIANYDRGWDKAPATQEHKVLLQAVIRYLESIPPWTAAVEKGADTIENPFFNKRCRASGACRCNY